MNQPTADALLPLEPFRILLRYSDAGEDATGAPDVLGLSMSRPRQDQIGRINLARLLT